MSREKKTAFAFMAMVSILTASCATVGQYMPSSPALRTCTVRNGLDKGWKFIPRKYIMIDVSTGYKFVIVDAYNYSEIEHYTNAGPQFGLGFKMFFRKKEEN